MRTSPSPTSTTTRHVTAVGQTNWTTYNWYTGGAITRTTRGSGIGRQRLESDDEQSSRPVLRGLGRGNEARLPDTCPCGSSTQGKRRRACPPRSRISSRRRRQSSSRPSACAGKPGTARPRDRKSTRLNSSHVEISYAVFCLKKKKETNDILLRLSTLTRAYAERTTS